MASVAPTAAPEEFIPCPGCGYDLRGHPEDTRCPECGREVHVSAAFSQSNRWADLRLLDLWSIGVLQTVGSVCTLVSLLAIARGQYVAMPLGLAAGLYVATATLWYVAILVDVLVRCRRPGFRLLSAARRRELVRWVIADAVLVALLPALVLILWSAWPA